MKRSPIKAYEEVINFIAAGPSSQQVAEYRPSDETQVRVADLLAREKTTDLTPDETSELRSYRQLEHIMRLARARARQHLAAGKRNR